MTTEEQASSLICFYEGSSPSAKEMKEALEKGDVRTKQDTLSKMIMLQLNGEPQNHLIMTVIKYCTPEEDHTLKKLLIYFWEVVDKQDDEGKLLPEMILVCSFLRNDLQHANEYVRGITLRFLCKVQAPDLLEPLISSVVQNVKHDFAYVRRNAVLAVHSIYRRFPQLLPDAPELIETLMLTEPDESTRRHAFNMLFQTAQERAVRVLAALREQHSDVTELGEQFLLAVVESAKQLIAQNPYDKPKYIPFIFGALQSKSPSVLYQCASTLLALSSSPTATKDAVATLTHILTTHSDNNARLIVLEKLVSMQKTSLTVLQDALMDILRGLNTSSSELRGRIIELAVDIVNRKMIDSFVTAMKKELIRSQTEEIGDEEAQQQYRQQIVKAIHQAVVKHLDAAGSVVPIMLDYVCEAGASAYDVILFIREVMAACPHLHADILNKLASMFHMISSAKVMRTVLWLFGVHSRNTEEIAGVVRQLKAALEPFPLTPLQVERTSAADEGASTVATTTVREDGTYVMNIALVSKREATERSDLAGLRAMIIGGDYFLASTLASTLAKLVVHVFHTHASPELRASLQVDAMEIMREIIQFGVSRVAPVPIDDDCHERTVMALTLTQNPKNEFLKSLVEDSLSAFESTRTEIEKVEEKQEETVLGEVDQPMAFTQLSRGRQALLEFEATADDIASALQNTTAEKDDNFLTKLNKVVQLSGFCDPVYAEATVNVHQFDIQVEIYAINQTAHTLSNLSIELATTGDLKLCERPQTFILPPGAEVTVKNNIKVSSTETGVIFGSIVFDAPGTERASVILNEIHVDIMEYIHPDTCHPTDFRSMWIEFEWENKIVVNTELTDPHEFVQYVMAQTNMRPIEPVATEDCGYLSCSLYAKSTFGEDALANISLERADDGTISGVVRIRSKTQGIALGLGDKVGMKGKMAK